MTTDYIQSIFFSSISSSLLLEVNNKRILRTIGRYFFPLNTLASTYRQHRLIQGWS